MLRYDSVCSECNPPVSLDVASCDPLVADDSSREGTIDAVEAALTDAIKNAANAGHMDSVKQLMRELDAHHARRDARTAPNVVPIDTKRRRST